MFRIDRLGARDGERLRAVRLQSLRDAPDAFETRFEDEVAQPREHWERQVTRLATFIAVSNECDVGIVRGVRDDERNDTAWLVSMWVASHARRQGIAGKLIDSVVTWAKSEGFNRLLLDVGQSNIVAIALYTSKGFAANGVTGALSPPRDHIREIQLEMRL